MTCHTAMKRAAQPETVKDYRVIGRSHDGKEHTLATVKGNFQRLNRHHQSMVAGTGGRSLRAGLWLARQMSKMMRAAGKNKASRQ